jgi:ribosome maturation factor RimP
MTIDTQVQAVEKMMEGILNDDPQYFLVEVKIRPTNNIKVFIDGDNGISIEKCISYNRQLYKMIEESGVIPPDDFSLEVSSPGLDEPLKLYRQYKKNTGRKVEVVLKDGNKVEGILKEVSEQEITVEEAKSKKPVNAAGGKPGIPSKKKELIEHKISFESIKSTKIQIVF